jgi:septal ring factor EnvC (AmiA/AmiB activator)
MDYTAMLNGPHGAYLVSIIGFCLFMAAMAAAVPFLSRSGCKEVAEHIKDLRDDFKDLRGDIKDISKSFEKLVDSVHETNEKLVETVTELRVDIASNVAPIDKKHLHSNQRIKRPNGHP